MDILQGLLVGLETVITPINLFYCFAGVFVGTLIGVLPGLGPGATLAILLPATFAMPAETALIMLAGIYYGAQYGGSTTAILINVPGESSSVVTALDGHAMARKGRAGVALATAAIASFVAGTIATFVIAFGAPALTVFALQFGPADYASLMILGLIASIVIARGSPIKAVAMIILGLLFGMIGTDINSGTIRYSEAIPELYNGVSFVALAMGLFGLSEIMNNLSGDPTRRGTIAKITSLMPTKEDWKRLTAPMFRGTLVGSVLGILPGGGAMLSSFASYSIEKKVSGHEAEFGHGAIEGVAGPEAANNAGAQTSFIPMLTLGIPSTPAMALMLGALIVQGIQPGPLMMTNQPTLFWGIIASMWIGNIFLLILNLPLVGMWVKIMQVPYTILFPAVVAFCAIGAYSINFSVFDIYVMIAFAVVGVVFTKLDCEPAPLLLGFIIGPLFEENVRRALTLSRGDGMVFLTRPLSATMLAIALVALVLALTPALRRKREEVFVDD
jgi:putative tricarboxylic transport membrane protein